MEATKMFDTWVDYQNKLMNNFVDTSSKMQKATQEGTMVEKGAEIYKQWLDGQQGIIKEAAEKGQKELREVMPNGVVEMMDKQKEAVEKMVNGVAGMNAVNEMFNTKNIFSPEAYNMSESKKTFDQWMGMYNGWFKSFGDLNGKQNGFNFNSNNMMGDIFGKMFDSSKSYVNVFEMWEPFAKMTQNKQYDFEAYKNLVNWDSFSNNMKSFFSNDLMENGKKFYEEMGKFQESMFKGGSVNMPSYEEFTKNFPALGNDSFKGLYDLQSKSVEAANKMYQPLLALMQPSQEKEMMQDSKAAMESFLAYQTKYAEMQSKVFQTLQGGMEKTTKKLFELAKDGKPAATYNEFFTKWVDFTEDELLGLYNSKEFSVLQGEIMSSALTVRTKMDKFYESALTDYPVVTRTEANDLYKTIHDLKVRLRKLENELAEVTVAEEVVDAAAPKKNNPKK